MCDITKIVLLLLAWLALCMSSPIFCFRSSAQQLPSSWELFFSFLGIHHYHAHSVSDETAHQLISSSAHPLISSSAHQLISSSTHQLTPAHQLIAWFASSLSSHYSGSSMHQIFSSLDLLLIVSANQNPTCPIGLIVSAYQNPTCPFGLINETAHQLISSSPDLPLHSPAITLDLRNIRSSAP